MSNSNIEKIMIQEYPADAAGQYAGWLNLAQIPEVPVIRGAITYARIGHNGAEHFTSKLADDELAMPHSSGFENPVSVEFTQHPSEPATGYNEVRATLAPGAPWNSHRFSNERVDLQPVIMPGEGTWVLGGKEILKTLKEKLAERDLEWFYATIYHTLAYVAREEDLLADPEMHGETTTQVSLLQEHILTLEDIETRDNIMQNNLTVFADLPPDEIADAFAQSRRAVRDSERTLEHLSKTITLGRNIPTIGFRPSGRSWPYMDASIDDEVRSFGRELTALKDRITWPSSRELERELGEIRLRREAVERIKDRLGVLALKESQAA